MAASTGGAKVARIEVQEVAVVRWVGPRSRRSLTAFLGAAAPDGVEHEELGWFVAPAKDYADLWEYVDKINDAAVSCDCLGGRVDALIVHRCVARGASIDRRC
jgi:hypothetical protein